MTTQIKFMHPQLGRGRATLAVQVDQNGRFVRYNFALCSPKDRFVRKLGRAIAEGRLRKASYDTGLADHENPREEAYCDFLCLLLGGSGKFPSWAVRAAKRELRALREPPKIDGPTV